MSGSGGSSTTVQKADPWSGLQPSLTNLYSSATDLSNSGGPQVYQGSSVSPITGAQQTGMTSLENIGNGGYGNLNPAQLTALYSTQQMADGSDPGNQLLWNLANGGGDSATMLKNIMGGNTDATQALTSMLSSNYTNPNNNPGFQAAMDAANQNTTRNFQTAVMPQLASQFSLAGRYGSGAQSQGISDATNNLATQISGSNATMAQNAWSQLTNNQLSAAGTLGSMQSSAAQQLGSQQLNAEQLLNSRQTGALQMLPSMALQGTQNANAAIQSGNMQQTQNQAELSSAINLFNANQQQPYQNIQWLNSILNGGLSLSGSTSTQTGGGASTLQSGLGGALSGAAVGNMIGGAGSSGGMYGAIGGGILGMI